MAEFTTYHPTAALTLEERTRAGYYGAIKSWAMAQPDILQYYTAEADDTTFTITFTPTAENIKHFKLDITVESNGYVYLKNIYSENSKTNVYFDAYNLNKDVPFAVYNDGNNFAISMGAYATTVANLSGKMIDNNTVVRFVVVTIGNYLYICAAGTVNVYAIGNTYSLNRQCGGQSETYLITRAMIPDTGILADSLYTLEGGMSLPPAGISKIGGKRYFRLHNNIMLRLEG